MPTKKAGIKNLERDLKEAYAKINSVERASEKGAETVIDHATEISTKVMEKLAKPKPF